MLLSRSQVRNAKRKHTLACLKQGIVIADERRRLYESTMQLLRSDEAVTVLESIAVHRDDCRQLQHNVHFAAEANYEAYSAGLKSSCSHSQHKRLHRLANIVKHEHGNAYTDHTEDSFPLPLPPPPPPPDPLPTCDDIERLLALPSPASAPAKVQYIVVEVPSVHTCAEPTAPSAHSDVDPLVHSKPDVSLLIDEVSMVFALGGVDVTDVCSLRERCFQDEYQPDIMRLLREESCQAKYQPEIINFPLAAALSDEQESVESAREVVVQCGFCAGISCVFCTSPVTLSEPLRVGPKAEACTQQ